jgi:hypothetical protein
MNCNQLLFWLSHLGEGTWDAYSKAVHELAEEDEKDGEKLSILIKRTRYRLSDIGSVDFFPEKRKRWRIVDPVLASFPDNPDRAVLCGGRSPALNEELRAATCERQCVIETIERPSLPDQILIKGSFDSLRSIASSCRVRHSADFAEEMVRRFIPIEVHLASAPRGELMIGWKRRFFDLQALEWRADPILRTACECVSEYGRRMTFLQVSRTKTVLLPRREAIYAAAALAGVSIISYDATSLALRVPMHAPLPEPCARLACISSGNVGGIENGTVLYNPVPPRVARLILVSLGQG